MTLSDILSLPEWLIPAPLPWVSYRDRCVGGRGWRCPDCFVTRIEIRDYQLLAEATLTTTKRLPPVHPGEILREEFMLPMALSSSALARAIGVTPARVNDIANERRGVTADTALHLGRYFGTTAEVWINLQKAFELEVARRSLGEALARIQPRAA